MRLAASIALALALAAAGCAPFAGKDEPWSAPPPFVRGDTTVARFTVDPGTRVRVQYADGRSGSGTALRIEADTLHLDGAAALPLRGVREVHVATGRRETVASRVIAFTAVGFVTGFVVGAYVGDDGDDSIQSGFDRLGAAIIGMGLGTAAGVAVGTIPVRTWQRVYPASDRRPPRGGR